MKLSVNLVTWNGAKFIPALFDSLKNQTFKNWELIIIDNGSTDGTVEAVKMFPPSLCPPAGEAGRRGEGWCEFANLKFFQNNTNLGFAAAHNRAFGLSEAEYFLVLNQDIVLAPDCLEKLVNFLDKNLEAAVVAPALYRFYHAEPVSASGSRNKFGMTGEIDSLGLKIWRSRRVTEITELKNSEPQEVFGVSCAAAMFRRLAAAEVLIEDELFDTSFFSYQEDVDLAWRLRLFGFRAFCLPLATATHARTAAGAQGGDLAAAKNKKNQSEMVRFNSYKNHLMTIYKNEDGRNFALDFLWIKWYEGKKFVYFLLFDRQVLGGLKQIWNSRRELKAKRLEIKQRTKVDWRELRRWWR